MNTTAIFSRIRFPQVLWITSILMLILWSTLGELYAQNRKIYIESNGGVTTYRSSDAFSKVELQYEGEFKINEEETDIISISPRGFLRFSKKTFGNARKIEIESDSKGNLERTYFEGNKRTNYEPEGKKFLADVLIEIIRISGIAAEQRVARIFKKSGVNGVLNEIGEISSSSIKGNYFDALLQQSPLNNGDLKNIVQAVGTEVSSSSEKGRILKSNAKLFLTNAEVADAFFKAVKRISSSSTKGSVLASVIRDGNLTDTMKLSLLDAIESISSSSETGSVLRDFQDIFSNSNEVVDAYFDAVRGISSSSEKGSVLRHLISRSSGLDENAYRLLFECTQSISSSSEKGSVLRSALRSAKFTEEGYRAFFRTVESISSSSEKGSILRELSDREDLPDHAKISLFETAEYISSSSEKGSVLRDGAKFLQRANPKVIDAYFEAVESISSSSETGYVLKRVLRSNPEKELVIATLEASERISSSSEKSSVLRSVESKWLSDDEVRNAYRSAARTISSDSEYRRVIELLDK